MMKCKAENEHETGMLEYLEDIIGTSRYKVENVVYQILLFISCVCVGAIRKIARESRVTCRSENRKM